MAEEAVTNVLNFITRKGGTVLLCNGYQYYKNSCYKNGAELWRCACFKKMKCTGFITIQDNRVIKERPHNKCTKDEIKNDVDIAMAVLKEDVVKSDRPIPQLFNEAIVKLQDGGIDLVTKLPEFRNIQHNLYKARNDNLGVQRLACKDPKSVEVPRKFRDFILADYCEEENRIIIFCSKEAIKLISKIKEFFFDATYKSCCPPFTQLFTIHGDIGSSAETTNVVPLLYILMCNKKETSYDIIFYLIKTQTKWNPSKLHCDYEVAAINSIKRIFPEVVVIGCYYHWSRCVWRKAKILGHTKMRVERRIISLCAALPLLPKETITEAWQYIKGEALSDMDKFFNYFEKYWIYGKLCEFISVFSERHRTNNTVEGWNSKLNRTLNKNSVNILRLLNSLHVIDKEMQIRVVKFQIKKISRKRQLEHIMRDDAIRQVQLQLINREITLGHALEKLR